MLMENKRRKIDALQSLIEEFNEAYEHMNSENPDRDTSYWEAECERIYDQITAAENKHFLNVSKILDKHLPPDGIIDGERERLRMRLLFDITNL